MKSAPPKKSQKQALLAYLKKNRKGITTMEAMQHLGICRLSERIRELEGIAYDYFPQAYITRTKERAATGSIVTRYKLAR